MQNKIRLFLLILSATLFSHYALAGLNTIILLGPPGSGKGTQGQKISAHFGLPHISMGYEMRKYKVQNDSNLGKLFRELQSGTEEKELLKLGYMINLITQPRFQKGVILDSWPKYKSVIQTFHKLSNRPPLVIELYAEQSVLLDRILNRLTCPSCGYSFKKDCSDENKDKCMQCDMPLFQRCSDEYHNSVKRLEKYFKSRNQLIANYQNMGSTIHTINADRNPDLIFEEISEIIKQNF